MLVDTNKRDISTTIFGKKIPAPIAFSPIGINKVSKIRDQSRVKKKLSCNNLRSFTQICHPEGELPVARVAGEFGLPYSLSTAGSVSIEDAADHNAIGAAKGILQDSGAEHKGLRFYQLYATHDQELNESLLTRAHKSGYDACIMTLDTWQLAWRCVLY